LQALIAKGIIGRESLRPVPSNMLEVFFMINLAIIIAINEYTGDALPLPGCKNDGAAIAALLNEDQRFAETLLIDSETASSSVKQRLIDFVAKHKTSQVGDVFFYFTGHGDFCNNEFYYLLGDYRTEARKQTSLENAELDSLVRSLNPAFFAKVVDACHSGVSYVKDGTSCEKIWTYRPMPLIKYISCSLLK
jgi:Caspase domain